MSAVLLSPHNLNDDEALFGAYTCLRHHPKVIVVLRAFVEESWNPPVFYPIREAETAASCGILGCEYEQWEFPETNPDWDEVWDRLAVLEADRVWAPLPEHGGHPHHNRIGEMAFEIFDDVTFYATYTHAYGKTTTGARDEPEWGWEGLKRAAMACYASQANHPQCAVAFSDWAIDEYLSTSLVPA